jgi:5-methylcytosine-specific restriction endonuclease McrA
MRLNTEKNKKERINRINRIGRKAYNRYINHNHSVKKRILKDRTHGYCMVCRRLFPRNLLHIDHIVPIMLGGSHEKTNLQLSCYDCAKNKDIEILQREQLKNGLIKNPELIKKLTSCN